MTMRYRILWGSLSGLLVGLSPAAAAELSTPGSAPRLAQAPETSETLAVMTPERLETVLQEEATDVRSQGNQWQFTLEGQSMLVLADDTRDRMRIVTPIVPTSELTSEQVASALVANFHTALDARYAVTDGALVSVFVHPLSSLQADDLRSALYQVARLAQNFGTTYSSEGLTFQLNRQPPSDPTLDIEGSPAI